jgi:4'-phosphopantetheinyl transferase
MLTMDRRRLRLAPSDPIALEGPVVHIWKANLSGNQADASRFQQIMSQDELARAERFRFAADRRRFVITRGWLRTLLSRYLKVAPQSIRFAYGPYGKPSVAETRPYRRDIKFNVAHSGELAVLAFTCIGEIGIDVEQIRTDFDIDDIAGSYFSAAEVASLKKISPAERYEAFFSCWTRKEAFVKAKSLGLSFDLDQFDVNVGATVPARLLRIRPNQKEVRAWSMSSVDVDPGYVASVAVAGHNWRAVQMQCDDVFSTTGAN